jgi:hypothetical protein
VGRCLRGCLCRRRSAHRGGTQSWRASSRRRARVCDERRLKPSRKAASYGCDTDRAADHLAERARRRADHRRVVAVRRKGASDAARSRAGDAVDSARSCRKRRTLEDARRLRVHRSVLGVPRARAISWIPRHRREIHPVPVLVRAERTVSLRTDGSLGGRRSHPPPPRRARRAKCVLADAFEFANPS